MPFTQVNARTGGTAAKTKATNLSSAGQSAPWLNTPLYGDDGLALSQDSTAQGQNTLPYDFGDDGAVFSKDKLAQYGSRGYDESIWENNPVRKALRQVALGSYAGETTPLGTTLQILAGLMGVDAPADVRDLFYDLTHWEDTPEHRWQLALDLVAVLPLIGALKNAGKAGELAQEVLRHGDEISNVLNALPSGADEAAELIGDLAKHSDEAGELAQDALKYGDEVEEAAGDILPKTSKALSEGAADEPWLPANWKEELEEGWAAGGYEEKAVTKGAGDGLKTDDITSIYRAVGPNEYYSVVGSGKFDTVPTGMEVKQFGLDRQDTINFAERYPNIAAVLEVKIPKGILNNIGDFTKVDTTIFKNGTVTIQPENLDTFNKYIKEILHIY